MISLTDMYEQLAAWLTTDPLLTLANAVAWLDPLWAQTADDLDADADPLAVALQVTHGVFPDIYADAVDHLRAGESAQQLDRLLCTAITRRGIPLDTLESIGYGIPLDCYGAVLDDADFYTQHPDLLPIVALFGIYPEEQAYTVDVPDVAYTVGRTLADSLLKHEDSQWRQVGWALAWLFSASGNSMVDMDYESMADIQPLSWDAEDVAFAIEMIEEADGIMRDVQAGIETLHTSPDKMTLLQKQIQRLCGSHIKRSKRVRLSFP